jgi:hypothetical protein
MGCTFPAAVRAAVVCVLAPTLVACATLFPAAEGDPFSEPVESFRLEVENQNYHDATIYVVKDTPRSSKRLGDVTGLTTQTFQVPWDAVARMSVHIEFLADGNCTVPGIIVGPGDDLHLQILPANGNAWCHR